MSRDRFTLREGVAYVRADKVRTGDRLDFEGDKFADVPKTNAAQRQLFEFEFARVECESIRETPDCVLIHTTQGSYGSPPEHEIGIDLEGIDEGNEAQRDALDEFFAGKRPVFYDCGICGSWHPNGFHGDCRNDLLRVGHPDDLYGPDDWDEVPMEEAD